MVLLGNERETPLIHIQPRMKGTRPGKSCWEWTMLSKLALVCLLVDRAR